MAKCKKKMYSMIEAVMEELCVRLFKAPKKSKDIKAMKGNKVARKGRNKVERSITITARP